MLREGTRRNRLKIAKHFNKGKVSMRDEEVLEYIDTQGEDWGEWEVLYWLTMGLYNSDCLETAVLLEQMASKDFAHMLLVAMGDTAYAIRHRNDPKCATDWAICSFENVPEPFAAGIARSFWRSRTVISEAQETILQGIILRSGDKYVPFYQLVRASAGWSDSMRAFLRLHVGKSRASPGTTGRALEYAADGVYDYEEE